MVRFWRTPVAVASLIGLSVCSVLLASQAASSPTVSPAQAAPFLGDWTAPVQSQMGPATYTVSVRVEGGKVVGSVAGGMFPPAAASDISLSGKNLFLEYVSNVQGMAKDTVEAALA